MGGARHRLGGPSPPAGGAWHRRCPTLSGRGYARGAVPLGFAVAGVAAYACMAAFIALVNRTGMAPYVLYRLALGLCLLALW